MWLVFRLQTARQKRVEAFQDEHDPLSDAVPSDEPPLV